MIRTIKEACSEISNKITTVYEALRVVGVCVSSSFNPAAGIDGVDLVPLCNSCWALTLPGKEREVAEVFLS